MAQAFPIEHVLAVAWNRNLTDSHDPELGRLVGYLIGADEPLTERGHLLTGLAKIKTELLTVLHGQLNRAVPGLLDAEPPQGGEADWLRTMSERYGATIELLPLY